MPKTYDPHEYFVRWYARRCIDRLHQSLSEQARPTDRPGRCVVLTIQALESVSRSTLELAVERQVARLSCLLVRAGLTTAVADFSYGPFQIRPSSAFGWERRTWLGVPVAECAKDYVRVAELFMDGAASDIVWRQVAGEPEAAPSCADQLRAWSEYKGGPLTSIERDVASLVHEAVHLILEETMNESDPADAGLEKLLRGATLSGQNLFALRKLDGRVRYDFPLFAAEGWLDESDVERLVAQGMIEKEEVARDEYRARLTAIAVQRIKRSREPVRVYDF